jgi:serine/threonine-protein kinase
VTLAPTEQAAFPDVLPGGHAVLFTVMATRTNTIGTPSRSPQARIEALDLRSGAQRTVLRGGGRPRYVPTGHLLYSADPVLYAVSFDARNLEVRSSAVQVSAEPGSSVFAVSDEGTLVYVGSRESPDRELVWVDRAGREESLGAPRRQYVYPRLSPDGNRVALDVGEDDRDIWIWDIRRRALERFTTDPSENVIPTWTADGRRLAFGSSRSGVPNLFWQPSDGSGEPEHLVNSRRLQMPITFAPDGRLLVSEAAPGRGRDILALSIGTFAEAERLLGGEATELTAEVSPDGHWIAYDSNESGQFEIYVRPYPRLDAARWRISTTGGRQPLWARDGTELYYKDFTGALMAARIAGTPSFTPGVPMQLLDGSRYRGGGSQATGRTYDLSLDGSRFLMIKTTNPPGVTPFTLTITENWFQELQTRVRGR